MGLSQPDFSKKLGLTLDQLATIEYGRAPLRYSLGDWICQSFDINQRWLVEGKFPQYYHIHFDERIVGSIPPNKLFSEVYKRRLSKLVEQHLAKIGKILGCEVDKIQAQQARELHPEGVQFISFSAFTIMVNRCISSYSARLPPSLYHPFFSGVTKFGNQFMKENESEIESFVKEMSVDPIEFSCRFCGGLCQARRGQAIKCPKCKGLNVPMMDQGRD